MNENCTSLWAAWFVFYLDSNLYLFYFRLFEGLKSKDKSKVLNNKSQKFQAICIKLRFLCAWF